MAKVQFYFFSNILNEIIIRNIIKFKNISIIYRPEIERSKNFIQIEIIKKFCQKNKILFYIADNYKLASFFKADGIFLSSKNKSFIKPILFKKNFSIIGSVHNSYEFWLKSRQNCKTIMLSPIFSNKKYSKNKILNVNKFNLLSNHWNVDVCALGGINFDNLKKIKMCKASSIAFVTLINSPKIKKPIYLKSRWA